MSEAKLKKQFGDKCSKKVGMRISDLIAAENFGILKELPGGWHPLEGKLKGKWAAEVNGGMRLVVEPRGELIDPAIRHIEYKMITEVLIIKIENYH